MNKNTRISKTEYYLNIASAVALRSTCLRRRYGCVIVKNDEIIATGYNGAPRTRPNCCDIHSECPRKAKTHNSGDYSDCPAVHAEQNAMLSARRQDMLDATLYLYGLDDNWNPLAEVEPCPICLRMIQNSGIKQVVTPSTIIHI